MLLLEKVFQTINESGLDYCIQNKYEMMPEEIPSDIDMMYRNADESFLEQLVIKVAKGDPAFGHTENSYKAIMNILISFRIRFLKKDSSCNLIFTVRFPQGLSQCYAGSSDAGE